MATGQGLPLVQFQPNIPVELALKFSEGKPINGRYGKPSIMFTTTDDRVMFLEPEVAGRVHALGAAPGQPIRIVKTEGPGRKQDWVVEKLGQQPNGTFIIPRQNEGAASSSQKTTAPSSRSPIQSVTPTNMQAITLQRACGPAPQDCRTVLMSGLLREDTNMLVDVMGSCIEYSKKYNGAVSNDDVRALAITVYIQHTKGARA